MMTGDAEFVGGHVRSLRYRVIQASVLPRPSHRIVGCEFDPTTMGSSG